MISNGKPVGFVPHKLKKPFHILSEPTTWLHFEDVAKLLKVIHSLVNKGNTVFVIEHNLDVIRVADHIIDLGPEGGDDGGRVVAFGSVEDIAKVSASHTGKFLLKTENRIGS